MNSEEKGQLIFGSFSTYSGITGHVELSDEMIIEKLQSYLDRNIIDHNDMHVLLQKTKFYVHVSYPTAVMWMIRQVQHLITTDDMHKILYESQLIPDFRNELMEIFPDLLSDMPMDGIPPMILYNTHGEDNTREHLDNLSLKKVVDALFPHDICTSSKSYDFFKDYLLNRIDELIDEDDIYMAYRLMAIVDIHTVIDEYIVNQIQKNKYYVMSSIMRFFIEIKEIKRMYAHNQFIEPAESTYIPHIIQLYEETTGNTLSSEENHYMYMNMIVAEKRIHFKRHLTEMHIPKYAKLQIFRRIALADVENSDFISTFVGLKSQITSILDTGKELNNNNFNDIQLLQTEVEKFGQLMTDISTFMQEICT